MEGGTSREPLRSTELSELGVEGAERQVPGFPRDFQHQAIGEPERPFRSEMLERGSDGVLGL